MLRRGRLTIQVDMQAQTEQLSFLDLLPSVKPQGKNAYLARLDQFKREMLEKPKFNLISLFCGGGGLDLGLGFAGFGSLVASDVAPAFVDTVTKNLPHVKGLAEDAMQLTSSTLRNLANTRDIDLVAAGPPCQAFSILGKRNALDDPRGKLALKYFELIAAIQPKAFLFENVPGLLTVNKGADWKRLYEHAHTVTGYHIHFTKLNAASFGIPQYRERVVLVGFREARIQFQFPNVSSSLGTLKLIPESNMYVPSS